MSWQTMALVVGRDFGPPLRRWLALLLANYADPDHGSIRPSLARLAADSGLAKSTVRDHMRALIKDGALVVVRDATSRRPAEYRFDAAAIAARYPPVLTARHKSGDDPAVDGAVRGPTAGGPTAGPLGSDSRTSRGPTAGPEPVNNLSGTKPARGAAPRPDGARHPGAAETTAPDDAAPAQDGDDRPTGPAGTGADATAVPTLNRWRALEPALRARIGDQAFDAWCKPARLLGEDCVDGWPRIVLGLPTRFLADHLTAEHAGAIAGTGGCAVTVLHVAEGAEAAFFRRWHHGARDWPAVLPPDPPPPVAVPDTPAPAPAVPA